MQANLARVLSDRATQLKDLKERRESGEEVYTHIPTGLKRFDEAFGGLEIGICTLVVGHTGDGKTALLAHLAKAAAQAGFGVLLVLLEDPAAKLADRYLASAMGESANKLGRLLFEPSRIDAAVRGAVDDGGWATRVGLVTGSLTADEALRLVRDTESVGGAALGLVVVDYAQSFSEEEGTLERTCANLAQGLNTLAGERGFAAVLGSQAKPDVIQRGRTRWERTVAQGKPDASGFRPGKGDAMWARRLEQYCKANWFIFREGRWRRDLGDEGARDDTFEINVGKANFGPEGCETFRWIGSSCTILDRT